ncbi:hypothetical protein F5X99DRAFT_191903 [Biscogniauxia marginata]|nr:hypothetical protein F5X99DRAFT_191903 [Biscogniauxia marginata]
MGSTEEGQRLARAAKLNLMLQEPDNRTKASSIVQALLVYNVCNTQKELERIDGEIQRIRDVCAAQGDHRREFAEKQEEIRRDVDGLRLLVSEAGGIAQTHGDDLGALTEKVNSLCSEQTTHTAKLSRDIQFMAQTIDSCQQDFDRARKTIEEHELARVAAQREEVEKLRAAIEDMRTETDRLRQELSREPTSSQKQQEALDDIVRQQEQSSQFFEQLASKQGVFLDFLEKLPVGPPDLLDSAAGGGGTDKPATTTPTTTSTPPTTITPSASTSTSAPAPTNTAQPVSAEVVRFWKTFCRYRKSYRARAPRSDESFVWYFLKNLDPRAAAFMRGRLGREHPDVVRPPGRGSRDVFSISDEGEVFVSDGLAWHHVEQTVHNLDMRELQDAVAKTSSSPLSPDAAKDPDLDPAQRESKRRKGG